MKKYSYLLLLTWLCQLDFVSAQAQTKDSLRQLLKTEKRDSTRSVLLADLSVKYTYTNPDTSMLLAQQGISLARQLGFVRGEVEGLLATAYVYSQTGNDGKALEILLPALKKSEALNNPWLIIRVYEGIASVYASQDDYAKALEYDNRAKDIFADFGYGGYEELYPVTLNNLGDDYEKLNRLDSARFYIEKAYDFGIKIRETGSIAESLINLGNIYSKMKQPTIAMDNYRLGIPYLIEAADDDGFCESTLNMARLFTQQAQKDSCLRYAKLSFATARKDGFSLGLLNASNFLADYYKQHRVVDSAYFYLSQVIAAKDSLYSREKTRQIQSLSFDETIRQQEIATGKIEALREHKNNLEIMGITIGIIILICLFLVLSQTFIVHERWIKFIGIVGLLIVFEYFYIFIDPYVIRITGESPLWLLLLLVLIAIILEPIHHRVERWIAHKMIAKNKQLRLAAARRTVARLEAEARENPPGEVGLKDIPGE